MMMLLSSSLIPHGLATSGLSGFRAATGLDQEYS
jgi:hypothetical protein